MPGLFQRFKQFSQRLENYATQEKERKRKAKAANTRLEVKASTENARRRQVKTERAAPKMIGPRVKEMKNAAGEMTMHRYDARTKRWIDLGT